MQKKITMGKITRRKLATGESRILLVTWNNRLVSVSSEYVNNIIQYFKVCNSKIKDSHHRRNAKIFTNQNATGSERGKFRRDYNQRATNKYLYSTTNITRGTMIMAMGGYEAAHLIKNRLHMVIFIVVGR